MSKRNRNFVVVSVVGNQLFHDKNHGFCAHICYGTKQYNQLIIVKMKRELSIGKLTENIQKDGYYYIFHEDV